nr:suppressor of fused domain protein [Pedobacter sp. R20-19]
MMVIPPNANRSMWTYATVGMSVNAKSPIELHLFFLTENNEIAEILTAIAYYNITSKPLGLDDTVNFGRPWQPNSICDHGLISRPYLDGQEFEEVELHGELISFFWLIPITLEERNYRWNFGIEKLEELFEIKQLNYLNPLRSSVT